MKKLLTKLVSGALALCILCSGLIACGGSSSNWTKPSLGTIGTVTDGNGGFVAQTENYVFFINGIATSTEDNTFGAPVKGALVAAKKSDLSDVKVVVPKLFAASDYNAGIFVKGDWVYYGTPNTDKDSSGNVANSELVFTRTKLDGSETEKFFAVNSLSTEYRIAASGDTVYIVYYDAEDKAIKSYNTSAKTEIVVAKTDATKEEAKSESLCDYTFIDKVDDSGVVVVYDVDVYSEAYIASKAEQENYTRATEDYNKLYAYKVGDSAAKVIGDGTKAEGEASESKFEVKLVKDGNVYFSETPTDGTAKTAVIAAKDFYTEGAVALEIKNTDLVASGNLIIKGENDYVVYTLAEGVVYKTSLCGKEEEVKEKVAVSESISTLLFVKDNYLYYYNSANKIAKIELSKEDAKEIIVSKDTVSTAWYAPEIVAYGAEDARKEYLFYLDNSASGASYVGCVDLAATVTAEDTDDDKENDLFYLSGAKLLAIMTDADKANVVTAEINNIANLLESGVLPYETDDKNQLTVKAVTDARAHYNALNEDVKGTIDETVLGALANYEKAIKMANVYAKLDGMVRYETMTAEEKTAIENAYKAVKAEIEAFRAGEDYTVISALISNNAKYNYQKAVKKFESAK